VPRRTRLLVRTLTGAVAHGAARFALHARAARFALHACAARFALHAYTARPRRRTRCAVRLRRSQGARPQLGHAALARTYAYGG
jgi:hypothetical protein